MGKITSEDRDTFCAAWRVRRGLGRLMLVCVIVKNFHISPFRVLSIVRKEKRVW